jgi:hypothetical protein
MLILLDEAERIMDQTTAVRKKSYGVIRDLLDNADDSGGMQSSVIYVAATPDMFKSEKGFPQYDPLRSRLSNIQRFAIPGFIDWRGTIVDLTRTPLTHDSLIQVASRVRDIHSIARNWHPNTRINDDLMQKLVAEIEEGIFQATKPRMVSSAMATLLEIAEQNPGLDMTQSVSLSLKQVQSALTSKSKHEMWE